MRWAASISWRADGLAVEKKVLSLGAYGEGMDFFALKGAMEAILGEIRAADVTFEAPQIPNPSYHPGRCAQVLGQRPGGGRVWSDPPPWVGPRTTAWTRDVLLRRAGL